MKLRNSQKDEPDKAIIFNTRSRNFHTRGHQEKQILNSTKHNLKKNIGKENIILLQF